MCETEVLLSLDGGKTIYMLLTEQRNPRIQYFDWTVPNTPTNSYVRCQVLRASVVEG
jgi:hypothetical protein